MSRLDEISGGYENILLNSGSFWSHIKILRMILLLTQLRHTDFRISLSKAG